MPVAIGALLVQAVAPELVGAATASLTLGGVSLGISAASLIGSATIIGSALGEHYAIGKEEWRDDRDYLHS